jgi:amino acid transporter
MNLIRQIKTVLWSFIGLGRRKDMSEIHERGNPLVLVLIAFFLVLIFLGTLAFIAHMVVKGQLPLPT